MTKEIDALERNGTWTLTTLPVNKILIGCKWVYRIKYFADGLVEMYKARLVAKGFIQKEALAIYNNWLLEQLDVNNAFLLGDFYEEVYMKVPQEYATSLPSNTVFKLNKSLYGLKQANRQWFTKLTEFLTSLNFQQSYADTSLFTLTQNSHTTILLVYMDDILLTGDSPSLLQFIKQQLHQRFGSSSLLLRTIVGKLIYLTITRPDLSFVVQLLSQFSKQPRTTHMKALLKVLGYIKLYPGQVSRSLTEAEYRALAYCTCKLTWLLCLFKNLKVNIPTPMNILCDNESDIALASNPIQHARTKHIELDCHFVREKIKSNHILPFYIPTKYQAADHSKGLPKFSTIFVIQVWSCDPSHANLWADIKTKSTKEHQVKMSQLISVSTVKNTNHQESDCWFKDKPNFKCNFCNKFGHLEKYCRVKKARNNTQGVQQANVSEEDQVDDEHLFMASHLDKHSDSLTWLMDSGCTSHMTPEKSFFISLDTKDNPRVKLGDGRYTRAKGRGTIVINTKKGTKYISRVLYVPELDQSMLSVPQMIKNGYGVNFKNDSRCVITDSRDDKIATLDMENDSYYLKLDVADASAFSVTEDDSMKWHKRFGHFNYRTLQHMYTTKLVRNMPPISEVDSKCEGCELGKSRRLPFSKVGVTRATHKLEIVHSDVCGPMSTTSWSGNKYFILFIDDYTRMCWVYFLSSKASVFSIFKSFKKLVEVQSGSTLHILRTDNGGEYTSNEFEDFLWQEGVIHQVTVPYLPQQNGISERKNKTVMEMARSMLYEKKLPKTFWSEAVATSVYLLNRLATKSMSDIKRSKLDAKARKGIFVSYATESKDIKFMISLIDEVKRHEDTFLNKTYHHEVDIPEFDIEDTTDTNVLRTRPLVDVYESYFRDTFALVARHDTIKLLIAISAQRNWKIHHLDVKSTFLNGELEEEIYVKQPEDFEVVGQEEKVYRLYKALYGLKQAPRAYNDHLVKEFKKQMESEFDMSDMGLVSYFLGMEIKQLPNSVHISQRKYASDMLKKFKMLL
ncbi:retrovirus-related pol polyprotein from transposon TNT 1-94 [Tanacetum coccineum]